MNDSEKSGGACMDDAPVDGCESSEACGGAEGRRRGKGGKDAGSRFLRARGFVVLACVAFAVAGMAFHVGTGTPSAFGIQQIAAVCPLGMLETMFGAREVMLHPLLLLGLAVALIVLVGKAFCGWICPVPWLQRFFRPGKRQSQGCAPCASCSGAAACEEALRGGALSPVGGKRDGVQLDSRHAVLAGTLASAAVFGFPVFCLVCPVGIAFATIIGVWNSVQFNEPSWALLVFPAILILEVTVLRKWCSRICPISALVGLLATLNVTLRPRVRHDACLRERGVDCHACVESCPEQLDPHSNRIPECSKCGACVEVCPAKAISIKLLK